MFKFLKKANKKQITLLEEYKNSIEKISVPDLKAYIIKGYEEITQLKNDYKVLEERYNNKNEEVEKYRKMYEAALVTSNEFQKRSEDYKDEIKKLKEDKELTETNYKILKEESQENINNLKLQLIDANKTSKKLQKELSLEYKNKLISEINNAKGHLTKDKIGSIIDTVFGKE